LEKKREKKLSPAYEKTPYTVTAWYGDKVHVESPPGSDI
jgi:hypothetical protein